MAADVEAFLEKVSGPAVVVGHSLGGGLGAMLASKRPDLVRALVIEDTNPWFDVSSEQDKHLIDGFRVMGRFIASAKRKGWTAEDIAAKTARAAYPRPGLGTKEEHMSPRMQLAVGEGFLAMDEEMFLQLDSGFGSLTPSGKVDVPGVLLIGNPKWGAAFPPGLEGDFAALAPRMRIAAFDNVGHEIHYCKGSAARFVEEVRKVIAEAYGKEWVEEVAKM
ncbi:Alpha/Beta hydrolase protein [Hyaloraphidium curvatum]|nr:Alpha/Beta hydrolase protein [Hyaloraphidium curvatum]